MLSLVALSTIFIMLLGATRLNRKVNSEANEQKVEKVQEKRNLSFQLQLEEIENERIALDMLSEQEAIRVAKAKEIEVKAEADRLAEKERLAEEKELAKEKQLAEEVEIAEAEKQRLVYESSVKEKVDKKDTQRTTTTTSSRKAPTGVTKANPNTVAQVPTSASKESKPIVNQTSGFNFNGHHFPLGSFSGGGRVPQETNRVYQWTDKPDHFLIERISPAGRAITSVDIGTEVVINGSTYTVTNMERDIPNNDAAVAYLYKHNAAITFQTCETNKGANGKSHVRFWYAR